MALLNKPAYEVEKDKLIYDVKHPFDVIMAQVTITADKAGVIKRGQVIDCASGVYRLHEESGEVSAIVQEDVSYASDDTELSVPVYITGTFRASEVIAEPELTAADLEIFRSKGIILK